MKIKLTRHVQEGFKINHDIIDMRTKEVLHKAGTFRVKKCYRSTSAYLKGVVYEAVLEKIEEVV